MNFPLHLKNHWGGKRYNSFQSNLKTAFRSRVDAVERGKSRGLRLCTHLILGFPTEARDEMLQTPPLLSRIGIAGLKLHNLHVIKHAELERRDTWQGKFSPDESLVDREQAVIS